MHVALASHWRQKKLQMEGLEQHRGVGSRGARGAVVPLGL